MSLKKNNKVKIPFRKITRIVLWVLLGLIVILTGGISIMLFTPEVNLGNRTSDVVCIPTGSDFIKVSSILIKKKILRHPLFFYVAAHLENYPDHIKPGRYRISNRLNAYKLVEHLNSGKQEPVKLTINPMRTKSDLAEKISHTIEADSTQLVKLMNDSTFLSSFGLKPATAFVLIIPNTYELFWNTSATQFIRKMDKERKKFWNENRQEKSRNEGLTIPEVITLASIVEKETAKNDEKKEIAGVYMNRLKKGMFLQADPTLIFAWNDYTIHRVMDRHKEIQSPYNTYLYPGLPPGPICIPSIASIDAVLDYSHNDYYFFCAREDLSGYHNFARTLQEHQHNAVRYQAAIRKLNIH
ncbi:MAG: endolytic transglycosylase MltG [Bacteroidota bacterium]|nr:endolytic transglycosylase MltG [Bacteroidota bacterium]